MSAVFFLLVAVGGFVGAPSRYLLDRAVSRRTASDLPWGTLLINVTGSFVLGLLTGLSLGGHLAGTADALLATGFCGAYTTFSTFSFETVRLLQDGRILHAAGNAASSVAIGLAAAAAGFALGLGL